MVTDSSPLIEQFAQRIANRDAPAPDPDRFTQPRVEARIAAAAARRLGITDKRRLRSMSRMLFLFLAHPRLTTPEMAGLLGMHRHAVGINANLLADAGVFAHGWHRNLHWYRLSRAGEDWLLPIVRDESPAAGS